MNYIKPTQTAEKTQVYLQRLSEKGWGSSAEVKLLGKHRAPSQQQPVHQWEILVEWSRTGFKKMLQNLPEIKEMKQYQKTFLFTQESTEVAH